MATLSLTATDHEFVRELRRFGVLQNIKDHELDQRKGVVLVTCGDGDQSFDIFTHQVRIQDGQCSDPRVHLIALNGAALRIAEQSPLNKPDRTTDIDLIEDIYDSCLMKGITTVVLNAHVLCGKAMAANLDVKEIPSLHVRGKARLKAMIPEISIACFWQVNYGKNCRSYFFSRNNWEEYQRAMPIGS